MTKNKDIDKMRVRAISSSRYRDLAKKRTGSAFTKQSAHLHLRRSRDCMGQGTLRSLPRCRWRYGHFRCCYDGYKPQFLQAFFCHCWTLVGLWGSLFTFLKIVRRRPDTNGRGNLLYLGHSIFTSKMAQIKSQV